LTMLLAEKFADLGYEIDLILAKKRGQYLQQLSHNINLVDKKDKKVFLSVNSIGKYMKDTTPKVLISANERINIVALLAKKIYKAQTKVIITIHINNTKQIRNENRGFFIYVYRKLIIFIARLTYKWADHVVTVSQGVAADAAKIFKIPPSKIKVIHNPIVTGNIEYKMKLPVDHPWLKPEEKQVILGIGRLVNQKDFYTLLSSFALVKKSMPGAKLIILGEGPQREKLEEKILALGLKEHVAMPGFVDNPYNYLYNASVFVLSSAWEGFGNVLVEAMATGTPVVSTDCPSGPAEILCDGKYGPLVSPGDIKGLATAIVKILENPPSSEQLKRRANDFTVEKAAEEYMKIINAY